MTLEIFEQLTKRARKNRTDSTRDRILILEILKTWHQQNEARIVDALKKDFNKQEFETRASEIFTVRSELQHALSHLSRWMKPQKCKTPIAMFGHNSWIQYENKGVALIISPWNYPWLLAVGPLISALAAGNTVVLKPSEFTPHTSALLSQMTSECFDADLVQTVLGGKDEATALLKMNFHHVFFTGSTQVGKIVAASCAPRLISYTLELGGRSPVVVDQTADLDMVAEKLFWGKILNRSQTCVAPNHVFVHHHVKAQLIEKYKKVERELSAKSTEKEWTAIVSPQHLDRLKKLSDNTWRETSPTALMDFASFESFIQHPVSKEEIFGPLLPIIPYVSVDDLKSYLGFEERPLTFAVFSQDQNLIDQLRMHYPSGSMTINTTTVQVGNTHLPFGGIGTSGQGHAHGLDGFSEFSNKRSFMRQNFLFGMQRFVMPPYKGSQVNLIKKLTSWLT